MITTISTTNAVATHYTRGNLAAAILAGLKALGKDTINVTLDDLAPVDEFHIRGRAATAELAQQLMISPEQHVLDVGSGLGGASRYLAQTYGCSVTGLDLTDEYCEVARLLADRLGLRSRVTYQQGNALDMPFDDATFDIVWTQHASMNIQNKARLYHEIARVLKPEGVLALYDVLAGPGGPVHLPAPWAGDASISFLIAPEILRLHLEQAGFRTLTWRETTAAARDFFKQLVERSQGQAGPPPLGLHLLVGANAAAIFGNMIRNLHEDRIRLIETIQQKPAA
jgi:ubiquinone/menaquinone biosynthesis C-methylase UbiE